MLEIQIPEAEEYNELTREFITVKSVTLKFEHSLVSIYKWESKWKKPFPFLNKDKNMTNEEMIDYLRCMCITQNVPEETFSNLPKWAFEEIGKYMNDPMTATVFSDQPHRGGGKFITAELIYCWMTQLNIWKECEKWHINKLLTLIHVCSAENAPKKKMSKGETMSRHRALNQARRKPKK